MANLNLGAFELLGPLGEGGMGTVWKGRHRGAGTEVAVKVMLPEVMDDADYREAFEVEVRSVASLDHPHIVTILDFGQVPKDVADAAGEAIAPGSPYLVMEYARGGSVEDYFSQIRWPDVRELMLVILDALAHAHAREVIHRDLKPENILVGCGDGWDVKLTDFGLAHASDRFKCTGQVETAWGTPQYMAPEQLRGLWRQYGPWTDLYGLGCMAYELICGRWPYDGDTAWAIGQAHIQEPIPALNPRFKVPDGLDEWIRKLMAKNRANRFCHAADAAYALAQLPALDEVEKFGVLFTPPAESAEAVAAPSTEVTATQVMPSLEPTEQQTSTGPEEWFEEASPRSWDAPVAAAPPLPRTWRRRWEGAISNELLGISLGLFGLRAIPLVDRDDERDRLWELLNCVHQEGQARQILVEGAAGTGKSELIQWMCTRAREVGGARVLTAYHSPVIGPADGLVPMMERFLGCARLNEQERREHLASLLISEGVAGDFELSALLSIFEGRGDGDGEGSGRVVDREQRFAVIYRFLSLLARRRPIIVWLDDIQWGLDALGFAEYVERRQQTDRAPIVVAMTARSEALAKRPNEKRALEQLVASPSVGHMKLEPLEPEHIETLVRQLLRLNRELAQHILDRSEGVPLFAVQLVGDWVARGKLEMGDDGFRLKPGANIAIPDDLHQLWDDRVRGFLGQQAPEAIGYLELAAALGQEVSTVEWLQSQEMAGLPRVSGLVERLVDEGLARPMEGGWRFYHGMLQESLERRAREAGRWRQWNRCCAQAITELYGADEEGLSERLAWHWAEAGAPENALEPLGRAIDEAIRRSDFEHALGLIDWREELTDDENIRWKIRNEIARARVCARRGDYRQCAEIAEAMAAQAKKANHAELAAKAAIWCGTGRRALGDLEGAQKMLSSAREYFSTGDRNWLARAFLELGRVDEQRGDFEMARRHFAEARRLFGELGDPYGEAQAYNAIGDATRQSGDFDSAHKACLAALDRYRDLENIAGIADCLNDLAEGSRLNGELDEAREFAEESLRLYEAIGSGEADFVRLNLAMIQLENGDYGTARPLFSELVRAFRESGQQALAAQAIAGFLASAAGGGDWQHWNEGLDEVEALFEATGVRAPMATRALSILARLAADADKPEILDRARALAREQSKGIRHTMDFEQPIE